MRKSAGELSSDVVDRIKKVAPKLTVCVEYDCPTCQDTGIIEVRSGKFDKCPDCSGKVATSKPQEDYWS